MAEVSTRDRLIDAAYAVVAREGLEAASVKTIAVEANVTAGLLHYHFPSKDALMEAALRRGVEEYVAGSRARRASLKGRALIDAHFADARNALASDADYFRVRFAFAARALTHPPLAAAMRDLNAMAIEETAEMLAAAAGRHAPSVEDLELAATLKAVFEGIMLSALLNPDFPMDRAAAFLLEVVRRTVRS